MSDPRCPQCGATFGDDLGTNLFGELVTLCGHCGTQYETAGTPEPEEPNGKTIVAFYLMRCPHCRSTETYINGTQRPIRFHRCKGCRRTFQSVEQEPPELVH